MTYSLNHKVLILNQNYEPIGVINAKKALILIYLGKAELIERRPDWAIRTVKENYPYPSIVRLIAFVRLPRRGVILSRKNILKRDGFRCQYCGRRNKPLTVDHVIPKKRGGVDSWENLVCACVECNNKKGHRTPEEANMPLLREPKRPSYLFFIYQHIGKIDECWKPYLFLA
ncbi:MAG: HNH endonuclease [candidate division KSB1 bacterium]|nr:HNH endonuclease [candidate division KSB1 bacterium]MDQ7063147.1 HNH endonuclease [candidate division KSB1 bacterium]